MPGTGAAAGTSGAAARSESLKSLKRCGVGLADSGWARGPGVVAEDAELGARAGGADAKVGLVGGWVVDLYGGGGAYGFVRHSTRGSGEG